MCSSDLAGRELVEPVEHRRELGSALCRVGVTLEVQRRERELALPERDPAQHGDARADAALTQPAVEPAPAALQLPEGAETNLCDRHSKMSMVEAGFCSPSEGK